MAKAGSAEQAVREIRRRTRRQFSAEEKIRIVLEGLRGEESIAALCRREGLAPNLYYRWSKEFLEAGKKRLLGDTTREATSTEVQDLRRENSRLKLVVAELVLENRPGSWRNSGGGGNLFPIRRLAAAGAFTRHAGHQKTAVSLNLTIPVGAVPSRPIPTS